MDHRRPDEEPWGQGGPQSGSQGGQAPPEHAPGSPAPGSDFPTFGQTPGWQEEPPPHGRRSFEQQAYDQAIYGEDPYYASAPSQVPAPYQGGGNAYDHGQPFPTAETEGGAIAALLLAIASWFVCPVIAAVAALIVASNSKAKIRAYPERYRGHSLITAANVIAWANLGLVATILVLIVTLVAVAAA